MQTKKYIQQDAHDLAELIKSKEISAEEALQCAITRMDEINPKLNAIITDCRDFGMSSLKSMRGDEPFYGVPIVVKDIGFDLKGERLTNGSKFLEKYIPQQNSDFIERLLALGFIPFAKTNVPEFGLSYVTESILHGPCRNPYDLNRTPGGSSGGSAVAVATGISPIATASDGGGSIRVPAACCGLLGFKPTQGIMPSGPWTETIWSGMATGFVLTRTIRDCKKLFNLLVNNKMSQEIIYPQRSRLKIATLIGRSFQPVPIDKPYLDAVERMKSILTDLKYPIVEKNIDLDLETIGNCSMILIAANTCAEIEVVEVKMKQKATEDNFEPATWEFYQRGKHISASQLIIAKDKLYQATKALHDIFDDTDVILTPALAQLPIPIGSVKINDSFDSYLQKSIEFSPFTSLFNQANIPAMTIPVARHNRLPISVQFAARRGADSILLELASELQQCLPDFTQPVSDL